MEELVETERVGHVLRIVLNRPKVNALNGTMSQAIYRAAKTLQDDPALRVGIITAKGERVFSAGWDFTEASVAENGESVGHGDGGFAGITRYWDLKKPLIAAINGAAVGGGFEMALAADIILMADHAFFQLPELQRGFLPDAGGVQRLPLRIPYNVAMEMILSGRRMEAAEAERWGLVHKVVPASQLQDASLALANLIATGAPLALQALKEVMRGMDGKTLPEAMEMTKPGSGKLPTFDRMWASPDAQEGPQAFLEKRAPRWRGE